MSGTVHNHTDDTPKFTGQCASADALHGAVDAVARKMDSKCDMRKVRSENCADETCILHYCT
jgi:hypothetical protein